MHGPAEDCGGVNCPLGVPHPRPCNDPKKSAYPLGCSLCRVKTNSNFQGAALAIEEVKLEEEKKMVDNSELYARYNPLMDKVGPNAEEREQYARNDAARQKERERQMFAALRQEELENQKREIAERKRNQELVRQKTILNKKKAEQKAKQEEELRQANEAKFRARK